MLIKDNLSHNDNDSSNSEEYSVIKQTPLIPVESTFNNFVQYEGGKLVLDLKLDNFNFKNVDYIFEDENVLLELKCLQKNLFDTNEYKYKIDQLITKWKHKGFVTIDFDGNIYKNFEELPYRCKNDIIKLVNRPIEKALSKAKNQFLETQKKLNLTNNFNVVLIANDGNYSLESLFLIYVISQLLNQTRFSVIDAFVYFTVNVYSVMDNIPGGKLIWTPLYKPALIEGYYSELAKFINKLGYNWNDFLNKNFNLGLKNMQTKDPDILTHMKYLKK